MPPVLEERRRALDGEPRTKQEFAFRYQKRPQFWIAAKEVRWIEQRWITAVECAEQYRERAVHLWLESSPCKMERALGAGLTADQGKRIRWDATEQRWAVEDYCRGLMLADSSGSARGPGPTADQSQRGGPHSPAHLPQPHHGQQQQPQQTADGAAELDAQSVAASAPWGCDVLAWKGEHLGPAQVRTGSSTTSYRKAREELLAQGAPAMDQAGGGWVDGGWADGGWAGGGWEGGGCAGGGWAGGGWEGHHDTYQGKGKGYEHGGHKGGAAGEMHAVGGKGPPDAKGGKAPATGGEGAMGGKGAKSSDAAVVVPQPVGGSNPAEDPQKRPPGAIYVARGPVDLFEEGTARCVGRLDRGDIVHSVERCKGEGAHAALVRLAYGHARYAVRGKGHPDTASVLWKKHFPQLRCYDEKEVSHAAAVAACERVFADSFGASLRTEKATPAACQLWERLKANWRSGKRSINVFIMLRAVQQCVAEAFCSEAWERVAMLPDPSGRPSPQATRRVLHGTCLGRHFGYASSKRPDRRWRLGSIDAGDPESDELAVEFRAMPIWYTPTTSATREPNCALVDDPNGRALLITVRTIAPGERLVTCGPEFPGGQLGGGNISWALGAPVPRPVGPYPYAGPRGGAPQQAPDVVYPLTQVLGGAAATPGAVPELQWLQWDPKDGMYHPASDRSLKAGTWVRTLPGSKTTVRKARTAWPDRKGPRVGVITLVHPPVMGFPVTHHQVQWHRQSGDTFSNKERALHLQRFESEEQARRWLKETADNYGYGTDDEVPMDLGSDHES
eukprot:TRINITY_DN1393_c0_g1_i1.p1 TRINITY_DN1393_c0_g1~~TRINITY_DN1393_c0_g1_i1.p1  ORF type:complete len:815 (+),score=133.18 TRINITY_DN1393_c0_g1_i1:83-2446(+)